MAPSFYEVLQKPPPPTAARQSAPLAKLLGGEPEQRYPQFEVLGKPAPEQPVQIRSSAFQLIKPPLLKPSDVPKQEAKVLEAKWEHKLELKPEPQ